MLHIKRLVVAGVLAITLCPVFLVAMHDLASDDVQLNFQKAIDAHDFRQAGILLKQGANPNPAPNKYGRSLLGDYAYFGSAKQVAFLLEHGADPFYRDNDGMSALHNGAYSIREAQEIIRLLASKVGINYLDEMQSTTLHHVLSQVSYQTSGEPYSFEQLLQLGANLNHKNSKGMAPLDCLLSAENPDYKIKSVYGIFPILKLLYQHGANPSKYALQDRLSPEQIAELEQARAREQCVLARLDCRYLKQPYPYPSEDQLEEDQLPYKDLYDSELLKYLTQLPKPVAKICADYSDNAELGALLDPGYADAEAGEQAGVQMENETKEE